MSLTKLVKGADLCLEPFSLKLVMFHCLTIRFADPSECYVSPEHRLDYHSPNVGPDSRANSQLTECLLFMPAKTPLLSRKLSKFVPTQQGISLAMSSVRCEPE